MENPHRVREETGNGGQAGTHGLAEQPCPNALLCQRWSADNDGIYCRLCWRDFTNPKPLHVVEAWA